MKKLSLSKKLILATLPLMLFSCGTPIDRDALLNPKVSGKMITLSNVSDITKEANSSSALYSKTSKPAAAATTSTPTIGLAASNGTTATATNGSGKEINADVQKIIGLVASADRKAFLDKHLSSGGLIALVVHGDNIRIYGVSDRATISKIASGPSDLTLSDLKKAKNSKIAKSALTAQTREGEPTEAIHFIEIAAIEIEKSGVLESEKSEYGETKPLLNIVTNLPIEVSTHAILKDELDLKLK